MESPIDLNDDVIKFGEIEPFIIDDMDKQIYSEIVNSGEGLVISVSPQQSPVIRGGGLPFPEYVVFQIHFRWDSEHTINKEKFPLEVQIIAIAKECLNFNMAVAKNGVAVFSTLYSLSNVENTGINEILPIIPFISDELNRVVPFEVLRLSFFFPKNWNKFYRYTGSLTFPPFNNGVVWTIFKEKQGVTRPQMGLLCDILDDDGDLLVYNNSNSRNVKTVIYTSGITKKKCTCPTKKEKVRKTSEDREVQSEFAEVKIIEEKEKRKCRCPPRTKLRKDADPNLRFEEKDEYFGRTHKSHPEKEGGKEGSGSMHDRSPSTGSGEEVEIKSVNFSEYSLKKLKLPNLIEISSASSRVDDKSSK